MVMMLLQIGLASQAAGQQLLRLSVPLINTVMRPASQYWSASRRNASKMHDTSLCHVRTLSWNSGAETLFFACCSEASPFQKSVVLERPDDVLKSPTSSKPVHDNEAAQPTFQTPMQDCRPIPFSVYLRRWHPFRRSLFTTQIWRGGFQSSSLASTSRCAWRRLFVERWYFYFHFQYTTALSQSAGIEACASNNTLVYFDRI